MKETPRALLLCHTFSSHFLLHAPSTPGLKLIAVDMTFACISVPQPGFVQTIMLLRWLYEATSIATIARDARISQATG